MDILFDNFLDENTFQPVFKDSLSKEPTRDLIIHQSKILKYVFNSSHPEFRLRKLFRRKNYSLAQNIDSKSNVSINVLFLSRYLRAPKKLALSINLHERNQAQPRNINFKGLEKVSITSSCPGMQSVRVINQIIGSASSTHYISLKCSDFPTKLKAFNKMINQISLRNPRLQKYSLNFPTKKETIDHFLENSNAYFQSLLFDKDDMQLFYDRIAGLSSLESLILDIGTPIETLEVLEKVLSCLASIKTLKKVKLNPLNFSIINKNAAPIFRRIGATQIETLSMTILSPGTNFEHIEEVKGDIANMTRLKNLEIRVMKWPQDISDEELLAFIEVLGEFTGLESFHFHYGNKKW